MRTPLRLKIEGSFFFFPALHLGLPVRLYAAVAFAEVTSGMLLLSFSRARRPITSIFPGSFSCYFTHVTTSPVLSTITLSNSVFRSS